MEACPWHCTDANDFTSEDIRELIDKSDTSQFGMGLKNRWHLASGRVPAPAREITFEFMEISSLGKQRRERANQISSWVA
jgi:hypothetical protein